jgi:hypothetical protein
MRENSWSTSRLGVQVSRNIMRLWLCMRLRLLQRLEVLVAQNPIQTRIVRKRLEILHKNSYKKSNKQQQQQSGLKLITSWWHHQRSSRSSKYHQKSKGRKFSVQSVPTDSNTPKFFTRIMNSYGSGVHVPWWAPKVEKKNKKTKPNRKFSSSKFDRFQKNHEKHGWLQNCVRLRLTM